MQSRGDDQQSSFLVMSSEGFYSFPTDNCQGIFNSFGPTLSGDFYREPDDVTRGLTLSLNDDFGFGSAFNVDRTNKLTCPGTSYEVFVAEYVAPALSEDVQAFLESSTLQLSESSTAAVGNSLLAFFTNETDAKIKKMSQKKFTIKAEVFVGGIWCCLKVRMYRNEGGTLVEFQKRSGDTIAFFSLYRQASAYLLGASPPQSTTLNPPKIPQNEALPADQAIASLLEMADSCGDMNLLAEVAAALNAMANEPKVAAALRMPCAVSVLHQLEQVEDFRVAHPLSNMLACIY